MCGGQYGRVFKFATCWIDERIVLLVERQVPRTKDSPTCHSTTVTCTSIASTLTNPGSHRKERDMSLVPKWKFVTPDSIRENVSESKGLSSEEGGREQIIEILQLLLFLTSPKWYPTKEMLPWLRLT